MKPLPRTRLQMAANIQPPLLVRIRHYGGEFVRAVFRKIGVGFQAMGRFILKYCGGLAISVLFLIIGGVVLDRVRDSKRDAETQAHHQKIAEAYAAEWKKAFLGKLTTVCSTMVNNDASNRFTIFCHIGEKDNLPTKKLACTELGCDLNPL